MHWTSVNPDRPSETVFEFDSSGEEGVAQAVAVAREAFRGWREEAARSRGAALTRIANDLDQRVQEVALLMVREVGKPLSEARAEVQRAAAIWRYYGQLVLASDGETYPAPDPPAWLLTRRYPVGVCALLTPWNFPVAIPSWKMAPALGYGNSVLFKPAPAATALAQTIVEIANARLPDGILQLLQGDAETGEPLVEHPGVDAVSFTGSVPVGRSVAGRAAARGARFQCEMGGQNASLVFADADLDRAASTIAYAAMGYAGQKCTATSRIIVEQSVYEQMRDRLISAVEDLLVTDPGSDACVVGPLVDVSARDSALEALGRTTGRVLLGGMALDHEGFYMAPTLVEVEDPTDLLAQEELFAPVAALLQAESEDHAVRLANGVKYGLVASLFTRNLAQAVRVLDRLEAGLVRVNAPTSGVDFHAPFGGIKASSMGPREQGLAARDFYTETRTLLVTS